MAAAAAARRAQRQALADEQYLSLNTILQSLGQVELRVERRDESVVCGMLEEADAYMNLTLSGVAVNSDALGREPTYMELLYITGSSIRCIHLPNHINAAAVMINRLKAVDAGRGHFRARVRKPEPQRPENLTPLVGASVSEEDVDLYSHM